jgi:hypothetical protein
MKKASAAQLLKSEQSQASVQRRYSMPAALPRRLRGCRVGHDFDIVVAGGGCAGSAAIRARDLGASVLVVDQNFDLGGRMLHSGSFVSLGGGDPSSAATSRPRATRKASSRRRPSKAQKSSTTASTSCSRTSRTGRS